MTGIVLKEHKFEMVYARLSRRLRGLNMANFSDYVDLLQGPGRDTEISFLIDALTTNLTRFFREDYQLKHLLREVQQRQQHGGPDKSIRIWSAGCSSGQEPYSIGMALSAGLKERARACRILATDIDRNVLNKAKMACIPSKKLRTYRQISNQNIYEMPMMANTKSLVIYPI
ncbi:CheR family methyltransferase [Hankyongella ginsenosidimutans]|nr:CheR family methyltransferase [Hankyongella ginsenosidimutans]